MLDRLAVQPDAGLLIDCKVAFVPAGGEKIDGPSGSRLMIPMIFEFFFKLFDNLLPMLSLPFGLAGIAMLLILRLLQLFTPSKAPFIGRTFGYSGL